MPGTGSGMIRPGVAGIVVGGLALYLALLAVLFATLSAPVSGGSAAGVVQIADQGETRPAAAGLTPQQEEEVARLVRELLVAEPEIVVAALEALQAREDLAAEEARSVALVELHEAIGNAPPFPVANPNGEVTIVEFFDYNCGFCKQVAPAIDALRERHPDIRYVFVEYPVLGRASQTAALTALAVHEIGGIEAYESFNRTLLNTRGSVSEELLHDTLSRLGIDRETLEAEMANEAHLAALQANQAIASRLGIRGTPAFLIGERLIPGAMSLEQLESHVADARTANSAR